MLLLGQLFWNANKSSVEYTKYKRSRAALKHANKTYAVCSAIRDAYDP